MTVKKCAAGVLLALFFVPALLFFPMGGWSRLDFSSGAFWDADTCSATTEAAFSAAFPFGESLGRETASLQSALGRNQQNGYFYSADGIIQALPQADLDITQKNLSALEAYSRQTVASCYLMLIPTAASINQNHLPALVLDSLFNEKQYIQRCYEQICTTFHTVDAYNSLFSHQQEYLYYRTDSRLTALGCYYLYSALGKRIGFSPRSTNDFNIAHINAAYYGNLSAFVPSEQVKPDVVSQLRYRKTNRVLYFVHDPLGTPSEHQNLAGESLPDSTDLNFHLDDYTDVVDLFIDETPYDTSLLVFTDGSCDAAFPLIALHCKQVRVVDIRTVSPETLARIDADEFDKVLFALSVSRFGYEDLAARLVTK